MRQQNLANGSSRTAQAIPPLLKWPGGKRSQVHKLLSSIPKQFNCFYEPFLGGGALFFALTPAKAVISDLNTELINCYTVVRDSPTELISVLKTFKNTATTYYQIRSYKPRTSIRRAARFLYLTRLSFNGIHRVNLAGQFNVPYGGKVHLKSYDEHAIRNVSAVLSKTVIQTGDFEHATITAAAGDVVYFDPPYTVAHESNGFVKYNERIFSWADQERLAKHAKSLATRGCTVLISNADHASIRSLYVDARSEAIQRFSVISANKEHRRLITERLFVYSKGI